MLNARLRAPVNFSRTATGLSTARSSSGVLVGADTAGGPESFPIPYHHLAVLRPKKPLDFRVYPLQLTTLVHLLSTMS